MDVASAAHPESSNIDARRFALKSLSVRMAQPYKPPLSSRMVGAFLYAVDREATHRIGLARHPAQPLDATS